MDQAVAIVGTLLFVPVILLVVRRKAIGTLNAAANLVVFGAVIALAEHPQFAIAYGAGAVSFYPEVRLMTLIPHAQIHFVQAGVYAALGLGLLVVVARTLLRRGERVGWYALLTTTIVGGGLDLVLGAGVYQHGSPIYGVFGFEERLGFGWQFLYLYLVAWIAALAISYPVVFRRPEGGRES